MVSRNGTTTRARSRALTADTKTPATTDSRAEAIKLENETTHTTTIASPTVLFTPSQNTNKIKGRNVSGRSWKNQSESRASKLLAPSKAKTNASTWEQKQALKRKRQEVLELQKELNDAKRQAILGKKERQLQQEQRRQENAYRQAQSFAKELNSNKVHSTLKAMSKKQLRQIKKQRINPKTGVPEYVPAYAK